MGFANLELRREGDVVRLDLARPPLNVLDIATLQEMQAALDEVAADPEVKLLVLGARGKTFCAGVDVADHTDERVDEMIHGFHGVIRSLLDLTCPVLGAVRGAALGGGCELLMTCDVILAGADLRMGVPEIKVGVFPPVAAVLLPRLVGRQRALDLILTGRTIGAAEAREIGLISCVEPLDRFQEKVEDYVKRLQALSRPVLRLTKRTVMEGLDRPFDEAFRRAEERYLNELMSMEDPHEGLAAFMEKREPVWRDA